MRLYLLTDLEGVCGVDRWDPHTYGTPDADRIKAEMVELLTGEVNAAVEGAVAGGAAEVRVFDGHGSGTSLHPTALHPAARLVRPGFQRRWLHGLDETTDALAFVGQHAMEGAGEAVLAHSWSALHPRHCYLNGREVGEIGAAVHLASELGVPTVFLSGDRAAVEEVESLVPEIETTTVKEADGSDTVTHLDPREARTRIRLGMERAVRRRKEIPTVEAAGPPYRFREEFLRPPAGGIPFMAARWLGRWGTDRLLRNMDREGGDPEVRARFVDRRTVEFEGPTLAGVLRSCLGRSSSQPGP